ncbi:MAG TPA: hypothetical protein VKW78_12220 [Terriglobales bacterium]|jgi:hypothetical protein|nr:hypothetical protein [Terriglobales bacterium]
MKLAVAVFVGLLALSALAQNNAALTHMGPGATVNHNENISGEVLPGDSVEVPANSFVFLITRGDRITVGENAVLLYLGNKLSLDHGTARVETATGLAADVHGNLLIPAVPTSTYQMSWQNDFGLVVVYVGQVEIHKCNKKLMIPAGHIGEFRKDCEMAAFTKSAWTTAHGVIAGSAAVAAPAICTVSNCASVLLPRRPPASASDPYEP